MKYNLTYETYLPETISNFPAAPDMNLISMIGGALFYNWIPMMLSFLVYFPIVIGLQKLNLTKKLQLLLTGFILTLTTPIFYLIMNNFESNSYYQSNARIIAWTLCFVCSIGFYMLVNKNNSSK